MKIPSTIFELKSELERKLQNHNSSALSKNNNLTFFQLLLLDYAVIKKNTYYVKYIFISLYHDNRVWSNRLSAMHDIYNVLLYYTTLNDIECTKQMLECMDEILTNQRNHYSTSKREHTETNTMISEGPDIYSSLLDMLIVMTRISLNNRNLNIIHMPMSLINHYMKTLLEPPELTMEIKNQYPIYVQKVSQNIKKLLLQYIKIKNIYLLISLTT